MSTPASQHDESSLKAVQHLLGYYDQQVLAAYRNEPHKYVIESDYFEGRLTLTEKYYCELESKQRFEQNLDILFGYRALRDGDLAIVVWLPDLLEKSRGHVEKWRGFQLRAPEWTTDSDERFEKWLRRYIEGSWDVDNGPIHYLKETMKIINGMTLELAGTPLYLHEVDAGLAYPTAENTHRYQDSHKNLYGYFVDGLSKECITKLASLCGKAINAGDKNTVRAILTLLPDLEGCAKFMAAINLVSEQRRLAAHGVRPLAVPFAAFTTFTNDLYLCVDAAKELLTMLEREFAVNGTELCERHEAKKRLPKIEPTKHLSAAFASGISIAETSRMRGKTVERVEFGLEEGTEGIHCSEALIIHFTDGSMMSIQTGSNVGNLVSEERGLRPEDFHVDFIVTWVPAPSK